MRPARTLSLALVAATALLAAGCSSSNKGKIEGTKWTSEPATVKGRTIPAGMMGLEFKADGGLVYKIGPMSLTGTYTLGSGNTVTFHLNQELAGRKDHQEKVAINGNRMTVTDSDGTELTFQKAQ